MIAAAWFLLGVVFGIVAYALVVAPDLKRLRRRAATAEARARAAMPVDHWREMGGDRVLEALLVDEAERAMRGER